MVNVWVVNVYLSACYGSAWDDCENYYEYFYVYVNEPNCGVYIAVYLVTQPIIHPLFMVNCCFVSAEIVTEQKYGTC